MLIVIREMKTEDWPDVSRIYNQALEEGKSTFETECPDYKVWSKRHLKDCRFVLLCDQNLVGWCALSPTSSRQAYRGVVEVSIYIDREVRRHGLGTYLLEHLCKASEQMGYWSLYASIFSSNTASILLHKKCGFREVGYRERIAKDRFGIWTNTVILELRNDNDGEICLYYDKNVKKV